MANVMLGFPNRIDASVLSGGAWMASLPLSNLQDRVIGRVARTANLALASTQFDINLGAPKPIRTIGVIHHNCSLFAQYRIRGASDASFSHVVYDAGFADVWPVVYPSESLDWEADNWWSGKYTAEEIDGYTATLVHILPANKLAQYWRIEFSDTNNPAGYLQFGRVFIGPAWQPTYNMAIGASLGWQTKTDIQEAISGAEYFQRRVPYRVERFSLNLMKQDEAFANAFEIQRRAGIDQEILFIHDPDDTVHALRRRFLGRLREIGPIEFPYQTRNSTTFEMKELL